MAGAESGGYVRYGKLEGVRPTPFETVQRSYGWSDHQTIDVRLVGDFDELWARQVKPGMTAIEAKLDLPSGWCVRTVGLEREEAKVGVLSANCVYCPKGVSEPYAETWEVSMEEVQKALITHPLFKDKAEAQSQIRGWERYRTISASATQTKNGKVRFYYTTDGDDVKEVTDEDAQKYCNAVSSGIETYNRYLPVISRTTCYLRLPGVNYDANSNGVSGGSVDCADKIGTFDTPSVKVSGVSGGKWFKSRDTYSMAADGSWTRNEQWTYTDDTTHSWIYEEAK